MGQRLRAKADNPIPVPHSSQKADCSGLFDWHFGHFIGADRLLDWTIPRDHNDLRDRIEVVP